MNTKLSRDSIQHLVTNTVLDVYVQWVSWDTAWAEVMVWVSSNFSAYSDEDTSDRMVNDLVDHMRGFCEREKARVCGYEIDDVHWYGLGHLRELVDLVMAGAVASRPDPAVADVQAGLMRRCTPEDRSTIMLFHAGFIDDEEEYVEALRGLQKALGGRRPVVLYKST